MMSAPHVEYRAVSNDDLLRMTIMNKSKLSASGCWEWRGANDKGYGMIMRDRCRIRVHRLSYELWRGPIPNGMVMRHSCDNPSCVNPGHLTPGTQADNIQDTVIRGRHGGKKLTASQVKDIRSSAESNQSLADKYGLGVIAVRRARSGQTWKHVSDHVVAGA